MNVLVIDSDQRFRRLVLSILEPHDLRVVQSTSLREADLELPVAHPELIIMDCVQADGSGLQWLKKKRAEGLKTPVIFCCSGSHGTEEFCQLIAGLGVKHILHKPLTAATLSRSLDEHFQRIATAAQPSPSTLDDIEREIKALSIEYIRELPERFHFLTRQVQDLKKGLAEPSTAKNEAHKIKGTASSYGVHDVGAQAVIIDDCLKQLCNTKTAASPELWQRLENALAEASRLAEQALAEVDASAALPAVYDEKTAMDAVGLTATRFQKIVIIDDDQDFTRRVSLILGYEDMLVYAFNDARRVLEVLEYLKPDLLILDLNMPELDGFNVCKRIRIDSRWRNLPIVFLTAQTGWETRVAAFDAGADDYIPKPVVNQELIARVRVRAERSKLQEEVNSQASVNKLLWQALLTLLLQARVLKP
ncbi:MAG: response regulator [Candidatus Obscuribacterales bacterium]|nr:response regulator [Candidatus Obscuribacterales bacterium]